MSHTFYCNFCRDIEYSTLYREYRYIEDHYIGVPLYKECMGSLAPLPPRNFAFFKAYIFFNITRKELKIWPIIKSAVNSHIANTYANAIHRDAVWKALQKRFLSV